MEISSRINLAHTLAGLSPQNFPNVLPSRNGLRGGLTFYLLHPDLLFVCKVHIKSDGAVSKPQDIAGRKPANLTRKNSRLGLPALLEVFLSFYAWSFYGD